VDPRADDARSATHHTAAHERTHRGPARDARHRRHADGRPAPRWATRLRPRTTLVTLIGGLDLDLTQADVPPAGSTITKVSLIGGARVVVGPDVRVEVGGFSLIGGRDVERVREVTATAPVVRIRAWSIIGGTRVRVAG
jgi:hypothetical protein